MKIRILLAGSVTVLLFALLTVPVIADQLPLPAVPEILNFSAWAGDNAVLRVVARKGGASSLHITFRPAEYPNAAITPNSPLDLTGDCIEVKVTNPGSEDLKFYVRADDDPSADGLLHCRTGYATIGPHETSLYTFDIGAIHDNAGGMRGLPPVDPAARVMPEYGSTIDWSHIVKFQVFLVNPAVSTALTIDSIALAPLKSTDGIVDAYGQYTGADWPGKIHQASDLTAQRDAEAADLLAHPTALPAADLDAYGGWQSGPSLASGKFFRTQKVNGKWWLVTPAGHLFFSAGMDTMAPESRTFTGGQRAAFFTWLPKPGDPLSDHLHQDKMTFRGATISGDDFDFYGANLERKYGDDYLTTWRDVSLARLRSWGFNTVGNWSEALVPNQQVPYVVPLGAWGSHAHVSATLDYWGAMDDPFDPKFAADLDRDIARWAPKVVDDPYCIGYFVQNELSWCGGSEEPRSRLALAYGALALPESSSPAKQALIADLRQEYGAIDDLNLAWGTSLVSWDELSAPFDPVGDPDVVMAADLDAFVKHFADQYFTVVRTELRKADPNHLYLGCRFAWFTREEVTEAAKYCDVVSFNIYAKTVDPDKWAFLNDLGKPCLVGEFHFGALDRGMFAAGLVAAADQHQRGEMYQTYMRSVLAMPAMVGTHWFQYVDEPLVGRWDGENYGIGFVSQADTVYSELASAARATNASLYNLRYGEAR